MTQEQIIEGNRLIAEFMGACNKQTAPNIIKAYVKEDEVCFHAEIEPTKKRKSVYKLTKLKYHSSWNWLMPVIGKISENCEEPEELDSLKYALLCDDINTAWSFVVDYLSN